MPNDERVIQQNEKKKKEVKRAEKYFKNEE